MAVNYAELPSLVRRATGEAFSFSNDETTLGCQSPNNPTTVPIKPNVELHQYLNMMNNIQQSTCVHFGLTVGIPTTLQSQGFKHFPGNLREEGNWLQLIGNVTIKDSHQQLVHVANQNHVNSFTVLHVDLDFTI